MDVSKRQILVRRRELVHNVLDLTDEFMERLFSKGLVSHSDLRNHQLLMSQRLKVDNILHAILFRDNDIVFDELLLWLAESKQNSLLDVLMEKDGSFNDGPGHMNTEAMFEDGESDCESLSPSACPVIDIEGKRSNSDDYSDIIGANTYKLTTPKRGVAMLFINSKFSFSSPRSGSEFDIQNLNRLFSWLGYSVLLYVNSTKDEVLEKINVQRLQDIHWQYGSFVICFLSRGENGVVFTADEKKIYVSELVDLIDANSFPAMAAKPKFLFIDASSGIKKDFGLSPNEQCDLAEEFGMVSGNLKQAKIVLSGENSCASETSSCNLSLAHSNNRGLLVQLDSLKRVACKSNFVICMASFPSYESLHNKIMGSVCTRVLTEVFLKHAHHEHILDLIMRVRRKLSMINLIGRKQVPVTMETLTRDFYLFPV